MRTLRARSGMSQEQLAAKAGINRTYLGDVERGQRNVAIVNICKLAGALGVTLSTLLKAVERELSEGSR